MTITKANPNWKDKVLEWQASGKSARVWCLDNDIPTSTFYGLRTRLEKSYKLKSMVKLKAIKIKQEFVELKDQPSSSSPLVLEYKGVKIHLQASLECLRSSLSELQEDVEKWLLEYNEQKAHTGKCCYGKTPMQTFVESKHQAHDKILDKLNLTAVEAVK